MERVRRGLLRRHLARLLQSTASASGNASAAGSADAARTSSGGPDVKLWHVALALGLPIGYYVWRGRGKDEALKDAGTDLISAKRQEAEDLARRSNLSSESVWRIQDRLSGVGGVSPEDLGDMVASVSTGGANPWEVLCLFRNSHFERRRLESAEAKVGVAMLGEEDTPLQKLDLAWRAVQPDTSQPLRFERFSELLDRMLRTGHFTSGSIIRQTRWFPPEWSILSGQGVAEVYYDKLKKARDESISLEEFKSVSPQLTEKGEIVLWYLLPKRKKPEEPKKEEVKQ
ncbi:unnamed protein product (mitochondrion) [Plasmodiophora brassicae]|uniref:Uncharacterized protein n=1 Tax=Plasmodiophora brassicae TaxID=37360 RepID=A0A0G4J905_PLABS|nr:hypothetical protein PBRA_003418 [Plasmodiophora brassicae]SPQ99766.1 unnamed protein product [Plasmodiophora brassicae]